MLSVLGFFIHFSATAFLGLPRIYIDLNEGYQIRSLKVTIKELNAAEEGLDTYLHCCKPRLIPTNQNNLV